MPLLFLCPGCGQAVRSDRPADVLICTGCGKRLHPDRIDKPVPDRQIAAAPQPVAPPAVPLKKRRLILTAAILALALPLALLSIAASAAVKWRSSPRAVPVAAAWDLSHRAELRAIKTDAESKAVHGDLWGAFDRYQALGTEAAAHPISDPETAELVRSSAAEQQHVFQMLLAQQTARLEEQASAANNPRTPAAAPEATTVIADPVLPPVRTPSDDSERVTYRPPAAATGGSPGRGTSRARPAGAGRPAGSYPGTEPPAPVVLPAAPAVPALPGMLADQKVARSLDAGVNFLIGRLANGDLASGPAGINARHEALDALCVYALLEAGRGSSDPRLDARGPFMASALAVLKSFPMVPRRSAGYAQSSLVYARSLRAAALAVLNRPADHDLLQKDVDWLVNAQLNGAYGDDDPQARLPEAVGSTGNPFTTPPTTPGSSAGSQPPPNQYQGRTVVYPGTKTGTHPQLGPDGKPVLGCSPSHPHLIMLPGSAATPVQMWVPTGPYSLSMPNAYTPSPFTPAPGYSLGTSSLGTPVAFQWDNFNSEYGLMGVSAGAQAGCAVPDTYWPIVENHWNNSVLKNGQCGFSLESPAPTPAMSCAAAASLLACHERLDWPAHGARVGLPPFNPALTKTLAWLDSGDNAVNVAGSNFPSAGPALFSIERTALASGFKYFGVHDWYLELSNRLIQNQSANGAWEDLDNGPDATVADTAYMVLFLSRGRHPVLMNKLRIEPEWNNRPMDLANLARFAGIELERPFNWQVVGTDRPWSDWTDSPILYIASGRAPRLNDADCEKLKNFADAGGLIFTHSDNDFRAFDSWVQQLQKRLWPQYELKTIPRDSALYSSNYRLAADKKAPALAGVFNGSRYLLVHCPTDALSGAWQDALTAQKDRFQLGVNLFLYTAGRNAFRRRLDSPFIPDPATPAASTVKIARLKYDGNWDPEPYAWTRFGRYLTWTQGTAVDAAPIEMTALKTGDAPVAVLTGNAAVTFTDAQVAAVRTYVQSGGTLLVDSTGGRDEFAKSARDLLARAFPETPISDQPPTQTPPLVPGQPMPDELVKPVGRPFNADAQIPTSPVQVLHPGAGRVVFTPLDLTSGLLGTHTWGIAGYDSDYAQKLVAAIVQTAGQKARQGR